MKILNNPGLKKKNTSFKRILGVSEAVGTVLLLGISITIAGGVAIWTSNIDEGEEGLYVDLWASVRPDELVPTHDKLVLTHRGGDHLDGYDTEISIIDPSSGEVGRWTYFELTGSIDDTWSPGEEITRDITDVSIPETFKVIVVSKLERGTSIVLLDTELSKTGSTGTLPDLGITMVQFLETDGSIADPLLESGTYFIIIHVENYGADMVSDHFIVEPGNSVTNLRVFDSEETISFSEVIISHYDTSGTELDPVLNPRFGTMRTGEDMSFTFEWTVGGSLPRSLGLHTLNVKVNPIFDGELNYRNNYVQRKFKVDKELIPLQIHGPDPGIYDIYFSNDAPHSGDEVTVTVVVQNSGDEPVTSDQHVNLVVSTWEPKMRNVEGDSIPDWKMDYTDHYENWRSEDNDFELEDDTVFPTCVTLDVELLSGAYLFFYFKLEARVDIPGGEQLVYASIDAYDNNDEPQGIHYRDGDLWKDNKDFGIIQVLPKILVVDDDNAISETDGDVTSSVIESLVGAGVTIDRVYTTQQVSDGPDTRDAPAFTYNQAEIPAPAMEDYDIVIWITGYDEDPLTNRPKIAPSSPGGNIQELMDFMDSNHYLLIIGTSPFDHFMNYFLEGNTLSYPLPASLETSDASKFLYEYMGIKKIVPDLELPTGSGQLLYGTDTGPDGLTPIPGAGLDYTVEILEQPLGNDGMTLLLPRDEGESGLAGLETPVGVMTTFDEKDLPIPRFNYLRSFSTPDEDLHDAQYRAAVISWDVTQIKYLNEKIDLFANVLKWFDWEVQVGRDLAITRMNLYILNEAAEGIWENIPVDADNSPKYLDTVLMEAYVRNNGPDLESTSVMFYVKGPDGIELPITPNIPDPRDGLEDEEYDNPSDISGLIGQGGEVVVYKLWLAVEVGTYTFRVVVDPFHLISEINEENNDISYSTSTITSFVTKNNILVVDDDMSTNNFASDLDTQNRMPERVIDYSLSGSGVDPSDAVMHSLDDLEYEYDVHVVENEYSLSSWDYTSDLSILDLKRFNSVIWVLGDSGPLDAGARETFTDLDLVGLKKYLDGDYPEAQYLPEDHHENLMIAGSRLISDLMSEPDHNIDYLSDEALISFTIGEFIEDYIGIEAIAPIQGVGNGLYGPQSGDFITNIYLGVIYSDDDIIEPFSYESYTPGPISEGNYYPRDGMYIENGLGRFDVVSHQYDLEDETRRFNVVLHSYQLQHISFSSSEDPLQEIMFFPLHWFDTPDWRPDLVGRYCKMTVDEDFPVIGSSYLIQAEIANLGGVAGGGTVRFMDGSVLIKSENLYLDSDRVTTLEAIWKPNFAGDRSLTMWIDLYDDYDEVFDVSNNRPYITKSIFIFWDDMESGDDNWEHDSTIMMINGESPLDYLGDPTHTNIDSDWDVINDFRLNNEVENPNVQSIYHSSPNAYFMHEPSLTGLYRLPIDLILVIDTTSSMVDDNKLTNVKLAAKSLINRFNEDDRIAIFRMSSDYEGVLPPGIPPPFMVSHLTDMTTANKASFGTSIDSWTASGSSPLWDSSGVGIEYLQNPALYGGLARDGVAGTDYLQAVVFLTDGVDQYNAHTYESGSLYYAPGSSIGGNPLVSTWGTTAGNRWGEVGKYHDQGSGHEDVQRYDPENGAVRWMELKYQNTEQGWDGDDGTGGDNSEDRYGLVEASNLFYYVGLDLPVQGEDPTLSTYLPPTDIRYPFTTEYAMKDIAHSSGTSYSSSGDYFFIDQGTEVNGIFQTIYTDLVSIARESTRSSPPSRSLDPWFDGYANIIDKSMITNEIDLSYADSATLTFNQKYYMNSGTNGGIILIGVQDPDSGLWEYEYIQPDQPYTGNYPESTWGDFTDDFGNPIRWCWNGISGGGTMDWDYVTVDLSDYLGERIKVKFYYSHNEGGTGYGWFIDDVTLKISTEDDDRDRKDNSADNWALITADTPGMESYSGEKAWFCGVTSDGGDLNSGVDNSLYTRQIDLTNVKTASLHAMVRFNLDQSPGRPPDGFRIEVSTDNKQSWIPLNLGVRSSWGVSGTDADIDDGIDGDEKAYTGLDLEGNGNHWVPLGTLTRVRADLSAFTGNVINIRFRVVTNTDTRHYDEEADHNLFRGIFIDDVMIYGDTLGSTRSSDPSSEDPEYLIEMQDRIITRSEPEIVTEQITEQDNSNNELSEPLVDQEGKVIIEDQKGNGFNLLTIAIPGTLVLLAILSSKMVIRNVRKRYPED